MATIDVPAEAAALARLGFDPASTQRLLQENPAWTSAEALAFLYQQRAGPCAQPRRAADDPVDELESALWEAMRVHAMGGTSFRVPRDLDTRTLGALLCASAATRDLLDESQRLRARADELQAQARERQRALVELTMAVGVAAHGRALQQWAAGDWVVRTDRPELEFAKVVGVDAASGTLLLEGVRWSESRWCTPRARSYPPNVAPGAVRRMDASEAGERDRHLALQAAQDERWAFEQRNPALAMAQARKAGQPCQVPPCAVCGHAACFRYRSEDPSSMSGWESLCAGWTCPCAGCTRSRCTARSPGGESATYGLCCDHPQPGDRG
jgi:hypothetical protein